MAGAWLAAAAFGTLARGAPEITADAASGEILVRNGRLELVIETRSGLNPTRLRDRQTGRVFADEPYTWPGYILPGMQGAPQIVQSNDGSASVTVIAQCGKYIVSETFSLPAREPDVILETLTLENPTNAAVDTSGFASGFAKKAYSDSGTVAELAEARFCNIPYRRHTETGELCDYTVADLFTKQNWFSTARSPIYNRRTTPTWGAEGWAWYDRGTTLLVAKYNPDAMEWSLLQPDLRHPARTLRFGGAGRWRLGDPEGAARLAPGASFHFGETRYQVMDGDWRAGYAAFRRMTENKGHRLPQNYHPLVHWNELYDNLLWDVKGDTLANRKAYYRREDLALEADKARELGCQCLYLDPGWDTTFGSTIWAADRLGSQPNFVSWLRDEYHLALALHTPLAPWNEPSTYPAAARRMNEDGSRAYGETGSISDLCTASTAYIQTKVERLRQLCADGAYFLMFDGSWYPGPCWDPAHGHAVPLTRQEHVDAILRIAQGVHARYPEVLIEQHDPILGPGTPRYVPTYFMHAKPGAFDELWGFEYMIEPMEDIMTRRAMSLYYVNLAYDIPIYDHIRLNRDNANALMFWWYASTCRHLGMGAKPTDPAVWAAQKAAMQQYLPLQHFFAEGVFYGLDETIHVHTLPDLNAAVIDCFNLEDAPAVKHLEFRLADVGLAPGAVVVDGSAQPGSGDLVTVDVAVPAKAHRLVKIDVTRR